MHRQSWKVVSLGAAVALLVCLGLALHSSLVAGGGAAQAPPPKPLVLRPLPGGVELLPDIEFARVGDQSLQLDLYLPTPRPHTKLPVIIWLHGGSWRVGDHTFCPSSTVFLAQKGYAVVSIDYRPSQVAVFPAQIHDCKAAVRWLRAHAATYGFDPEHIGVWGESAGGHLAALLGVTGDRPELEGNVGGNTDQSSRVQAVCDLFGPTDFLRMVGTHFNLLTDRGDPDSSESLLIGGPSKSPEYRAKAIAASPTTYVTSNSAPFIIFHGTWDPYVPLDQSKYLAELLDKAGVECGLHVVPGGWALGTLRGVHSSASILDNEALQLIEDFFDAHLKPHAEETPVPE